MTYSEEQLQRLREQVEKRQTPERFRHTCGVERAAADIGALYLPERLSSLRAAAILHDLTKGLTSEEQIALCRTLNLPPSPSEQDAPQVLHGRTAAALIPLEFPEFATEEILSGVRRHTTGEAEMTVFDEIIFLADYIEDGRTYPDCIRMREAFWNVPTEQLRQPEHLDAVVREVLRNTILYLKKHHTPIDADTLSAYQWLCQKGGVIPSDDARP
jgi:nicotinate-nucleotide adenylyltransferase